MTMRRAIIAAVACIALAAPASAGPHDATSRHSFASVEHWERVFDDPARDAWQRPRALVAALALRPGMTVADVGAGTGYLVRHLAGAVGPQGTVFAVETEPKLVEHLRQRAETDRTATVVPILGSTDDPRLPAAGIDVVVMLDTYHHIDDRLTYFARLRRTLRPNGRLVVVDWHKRELPVGPALDHKLAREHVIAELEQAGWLMATEHTILPYQYLLVFRPRTPATATD
jgi:ubiquinone/menaquinone biosynthesis C-methylase UbiE